MRPNSDDALSIEHQTLNLKTMEMELMQRVRMVNDEKRRRRRRCRTLHFDESAVASTASEVEMAEIVIGLPDWEPVEPPPPVIIPKKEASRKRRIDEQNHEDATVVTDEEIQNKRLSSEEILKLPKFKNYEPGEPNQVLYVKNLANGTCETDLMAIFGRYENVKCRLMSGKMRGQAFVTFSDADTATKALAFLHGIVWKGKPIVIEYGKSVNRP